MDDITFEDDITWWMGVIDFSKNFDNFREIDEEEKNNIFNKLKKLDPLYPDPDLNLYPDLYPDPDPEDPYLDIDTDLYAYLDIDPPPNLDPYTYISAVFNRLCWNYVVGKDLSDEVKEQLKYNNNKKVNFLTYGELEDLLEDFCKNHTQYNGKLKQLKETKVSRKGYINFSDEVDVLRCIGFVFPKRVTYFEDPKNVDFRYSIFLEEIDFNDAKFSGNAYFKGAKFSKEADFRGAKFSKEANFLNAKFSQFASFRYAKFSGNAYFKGAAFSKEANFRGAKFSKDANFSGTKFSQFASFREVAFSREAGFRGATFSQDAYFYSATFSQIADFCDAEFSGHSFFNHSKFEVSAYFQKVTFCKWVPQFFEATLKEDTSFFEVKWPEKTQDKEKADIQARAYGRLSLIMEGLKRKEDKLFFFTKKMKIQRWLEKDITYKVFNFCYEITSNYGNSLKRSFWWFVGIGVLFGYFYHWRISSHPCCEVEKVDYISEAFNVSFSNMLFFSSLLRLQDKEGYLARAECVTELIKSDIYFRYLGLFQIFLGTIFLFLLFLTLRNKFRTFK